MKYEILEKHNKHLEIILNQLNVNYDYESSFRLDSESLLCYFDNTREDIMKVLHGINEDTSIPFMLWEEKFAYSEDSKIQSVEVSLVNRVAEEDMTFQAVVFQTGADLGYLIQDSVSVSKPYKTKEIALKKAKFWAVVRDWMTYGSRTGVHYKVEPVLTPFGRC